MSTVAQGESRKPSPIPPGYRTVTPYLVAQDAPGLIEFVKQTFGAEETFRTIGGAGGIHAEVRLDHSMLMIGGGGPGLSWRGEPRRAALHVYVKDADAVYKRALEAGGTSIDAPADQKYGERSASVKDAFGNYWYIATAKGEHYIPKGLHSVNIYLHLVSAPPVIEFLKQGLGGEELARYASRWRGSSCAGEDWGLGSGNGRGARAVSGDAEHGLYVCAGCGWALQAGARGRGDVDFSARGPVLRRSHGGRERWVRQSVVYRHPRQGCGGLELARICRMVATDAPVQRATTFSMCSFVTVPGTGSSSLNFSCSRRRCSRSFCSSSE